MVDIETARQMALALPGTEEGDHFGLASFKVNKRIIATLWVKENRMMIKLPLIEQAMFSSFDKHIIYPVPNKYGGMGCTFFELSTIHPDMLKDALTTAWQSIISKGKKKK
jgi:hypothetical protein